MIQTKPHELYMVMPTLSGGGAERVAVALANEMVAVGYRFTFLLTKSNTCVYDLKPNVEVQFICSQEKNGPLEQVRAIRREMKRHPDSTFLSFLSDQNVLLLLASLALPNRAVVSSRNFPSDDFNGRGVLFPLRDWLYSSRADAIVFQTEQQGSYFPENVRRKGVVIENPLTEGLPKRVPFSDRRRVLAASGRLTAQKNYPMMLRVFERVHKVFPEYRLEIYGKGDLLDELRQLADSLGVLQSVDFMGFRKDAVQMISTASANLMTSDWEGLSNSLIEALAMGVPTVSTRCAGGGAEAVIEDGVNGFLVDCGDVDAMSARVLSILEEPGLSERLASEATKINERLSVDVIAQKWENVLFPEDSF
ncbi:GalNAc-alpha-(1-_4)-GalNAc-alpha-(1-_3)-diNAcBac-PP-undecaprenol alpha-1,4-N-acetyl-D-galactosaminyltransferase [Collinsella intestinalis]|uniref:GalNAc-alpha-(1->4)-GalNAc-alpha-(1->3)-diNAcBac-PP-undecaprenol alpha-1,4-N-acetyl-D-galactosaminyltransferase n=1 Tax=Collinsella intestinalis TaxID=147207 RepID=A0A5K1ITQ8_9ACTN|nr:glycosyltransferase [Collinsella intestinalis]VWL92300.1 GalNAc-alpha-(1->4)-GalNAc-alpha-(1->3)-diNAcBac-PP-undecaprenol alpha-1,4-N-acetyl-D-galactosaminyltransferase [Collinsella intestinalis]